MSPASFTIIARMRIGSNGAPGLVDSAISLASIGAVAHRADDPQPARLTLAGLVGIAGHGLALVESLAGLTTCPDGLLENCELFLERLAEQQLVEAWFQAHVAAAGLGAEPVVHPELGIGQVIFSPWKCTHIDA